MRYTTSSLATASKIHNAAAPTESDESTAQLPHKASVYAPSERYCALRSMQANMVPPSSVKNLFVAAHARTHDRKHRRTVMDGVAKGLGEHKV